MVNQDNIQYFNKDMKKNKKNYEETKINVGNTEKNNNT